MLIEAATVMVITVVGLLAVLQLFTACTQHSRASIARTNAMLIAGHVEAVMAGLAFQDPARGAANFGPEPGETSIGDYDDADDFDGKILNPPIDSLGRPLPELSDFSQAISVTPVPAMQLSSTSGTEPPVVAKSTYTGAVRVTVRVLHVPAPGAPSTEVYRGSWLCVDR